MSSENGPIGFSAWKQYHITRDSEFDGIDHTKIFVINPGCARGDTGIYVKPKLDHEYLESTISIPGDEEKMKDVAKALDKMLDQSLRYKIYKFIYRKDGKIVINALNAAYVDPFGAVHNKFRDFLDKDTLIIDPEVHGITYEIKVFLRTTDDDLTHRQAVYEKLAKI